MQSQALGKPPGWRSTPRRYRKQSTFACKLSHVIHNGRDHLPAHNERAANLGRRVLCSKYGNCRAFETHADSPVGDECVYERSIAYVLT